MSSQPTTDPHETPPPILGSWSRLYWLVFAILLAQIVLFAWMTYYFS
jgi:hypothetical protein